MGKLTGNGQTVILYEKTQVGMNALNTPVYTVTAVNVPNVLIGQPTTQEAIDVLNLYGRKIEYVLGIPKGDTHDWENQKVSFFGEEFRTFNIPTQGIDHLIPLDWNKNVMCERYE